MSEISEELDRLRKLNKEFNILKTLISLRIITKQLDEIRGSGYLILILDYKENSIRYISVPEENISRDYLMYEREYKGDTNNVVSVSVENLKNLKKAYPNYFLDAREFVTTISKYTDM